MHMFVPIYREYMSSLKRGFLLPFEKFSFFLQWLDARPSGKYDEAKR